jgi:hypothetical protein
MARRSGTANPWDSPKESPGSNPGTPAKLNVNKGVAELVDAHGL